ncbi:MAG TPA: hypothetical protein VGO77_03530, partial [Mycobacterium sp.]|nr:hypothetical protein [Mycobacterium sp.]
PPLIRVPAGQPLNITLVNKLYDKVPTSLVIVGQLGGGLGDVTQRATMPSPTHGPQGTTWPGTLGGIDTSATSITITSPGSGYTSAPDVRFTGGGGMGAAAVATISGGKVVGVTVTNPGSNYTAAPSIAFVGGGAGTQATATVNNLSDFQSAGTPTFTPPAQADRVRSFGTEVTIADGAAGKTLAWNNLRPGTYLIESGTQPSIQAPMGLYGVLVVTEDDVSGVRQAYGTRFDADVALLLSEIDPVQNAEVDQVVRNTGFDDTKVWSGRPNDCGDLAQPAAAHFCYPPAVNYSPQYYLVNGASFDRTAAADSALPVPVAAGQGNVLLRIVNAGLRMHVPSVVGSKMTLIAEDGNKLPGNPRVQTQVLLTAGKTYDVAIQPAKATSATNSPYADATYPVFDRALSLSTANQRDGGMQAYINVGNGGAQSSAFGSAGSAAAKLDGAGDKTFHCVAGAPLTVSDPAMGLLAGVSGANGVALGTTFTPPVSASNVTVQSNGTFSYTPPSSGPCAGSFSFFVNKAGPFKATIADCASNPNCAGLAPTAGNGSYTSNIAARLQVAPPGVLSLVTGNPSGYALTALPGTVASTCASVTLNRDGSFIATPVTNQSSCTFTYKAATATQVTSGDGTVTVSFQSGSGLVVSVYDALSAKPGQTKKSITDYRWIIEEDRTFWIDPKCQVNTTDTRTDSQGKACPPLPVESLGYNFHTANMPVVAQGCWGTDPTKPLVSCEQGQTVGGAPAVCDGGNGVCRVLADPNATKTPLDPGSVYLDPSKRYFISILPGDGVNPTIGGAGGPNSDGTPFSIAKNCGAFDPSDSRWTPGAASGLCGHGMGGAQIAPGQRAVNIALQQTPLPTAKIAVFVFQDDNPLNGENDAGGGVDVIAPNEAGLGGFEIKLFDQAGGLGDNTGQPTYDQFNQPLTNALAGKKDPFTGMDACPITRRDDGPNGNFVGMIPTCPKYMSDGKTLSPLAGQAIIANLYPGLYEIQAYPAADRIARGEEWLQTNTLDGGKPHEAFIKPNEPGYFQEFGPGGFHVSIGFANPKIINARKTGVCAGQACASTLTVNVTNNHMSRTPDQRTYSSGSYDHYAFTQCYVSVGLPDGIDFAFEKCSSDGVATFTGMPAGTYKISVFDQWNDIMLDGLVSSVTISGNTVKNLPVTQWRTNLSTRTYIDTNGNGIPDRDGANDKEAGLALVNTNIRYRDGSFGFFNNTDLNGYAGFNEVFPFMNWLVVETSSTRFKPTGVHTVYDAGGPPDGTGIAGAGNSIIAGNLANTIEKAALPAALRVPGAVYCGDADCIGNNLITGNASGGPGGTSGVVVPPQAWGVSQGWQGLLGQDNFIEFGMKPFAENENGGINGHVIYASTRPFDDPSLSLQLSWEPGVPRVRINLYSKTVDEFGHEKLTLVDYTMTTSWDDWAQGFRRDAAGNLVKDAAGKYVANMNCPGQDASSPFLATLSKSKQWLDPGNLDPANPGKLALASDSRFKCYDGWSQLNQIQPAPYDGMYSFPSVVTTYHQDTTANGVLRKAGQPATTNCTACIPNPDTTDPFRAGVPMLPPGKYVVEVIVPQGYELVKEEDKNILLGDVYIAPVTQQFAGFGNIFIMPDQATVNAHYNGNNPGSLNLTNNLGSVTFPRHEGDTGSIESFWPCVGTKRVVPDLNSLFPGAGQAAPFAGALRNLCDRKEVTLQDQASALAKFYVFSSTHIAGHFAGTITNDFASEFDPFSPQFGEKFGPPNLPVGMRDFNGNEVARVYSDQWGIYNGLFFSSWSVNPPNPTGYAPQMSIACMNDPGPIPDPSGAKNPDGSPVMITDPSYNPAYSNFCYETPFMPGFTAYMDTPVIPTQAFADGYNLPDSEYPNGTPAIKAVVNSSSSGPQGPWVTSGNTQPSTVQFTLSDVTAGNNLLTGDTISSIAVGTTTITNGTIRCNLLILCFGNDATLQAARNSLMAGAVALSINARTSVTHYSATVDLASATVTVTAPAGVANGTTLTIVRNGVTINGIATAPVNLTFGGASGTPPALGLTITALGDKVVQNPNFSGPNSTTAPFNQKTITRHYGFGSAPSTCPQGASAGACPDVTVGGVAMTGVTWSDTTITGTVNPAGVPACTVQQRGQPATQCGELVIKSANGKQTIDAVTVTIGGSAPWYVTEAGVTAPAGKSVKTEYNANFGRMESSPIQTAIDSASPGDLILVGPGTYRENVLMWKPVRLQGVGAASVTINADAHPAGKMDQWRRQVNCVFGLSLDGTTNLGNTNYSGTDPNNNGYSCPNTMHQRVDRIPFEAIVGWDASGNGNLAQVLQEPTLMGAYEGAGITVLGRGVRVPACNNPFFGANCADFWGVNATGGAGAFTDGSTYLSGSNTDCATSTANDGRDYGTANFQCNPSRIDGMSIINSSQGGGALFIHGWAHNLDVGNTRISGNHGTLAGGINLG